MAMDKIAYFGREFREARRRKEAKDPYTRVSREVARRQRELDKYQPFAVGAGFTGGAIGTIGALKALTGANWKIKLPVTVISALLGAKGMNWVGNKLTGRDKMYDLQERDNDYLDYKDAVNGYEDRRFGKPRKYPSYYLPYDDSEDNYLDY